MQLSFGKSVVDGLESHNETKVKETRQIMRAWKMVSELNLKGRNGKSVVFSLLRLREL